MIKAKLLTRYPAAVEATAPIVSEFSNGVLELSYDSSSLPQVSSPTVSGKIVVREGDIYNEVPALNIAYPSIANNTIVGNNSGASAAPSALTTAQVSALLPAFTGDSGSGGIKGLVPAPAAGDTAAGRYLKADGTFAIIPTLVGDSGSGGTKGLVPGPAAGDAAAGKVLSADGTFKVAPIDIASQAQMVAGTENTKSVTPLKVRQALEEAAWPGPAWASYSTIYGGLVANINNFPVTSRFGSNIVGCAEAMAGLVDVPSTSAAGNHSAGVAGYARSASTSQGGVGTFGAGMCAADGVSAWAFNSIITNAAVPNPGNGAGYDTCTLYAFELDFNIMKKGGATPTGPLRGLYFIGASEVQPNSPTVNTIEIDGLNFTGTKIPWKQAFVVCDGAAQTFANIGAINVNTGSTTSDGQPIKASAFLGGVLKGGQIYLNSLGNWWIEPASGSGIDTPSGTTYQVAGATVADNLAWTAWTPTVTTGAGTITTLGTVVARYKRLGKRINFTIKIPITTNGTGSGNIAFTLPGGFTPFADFAPSGYENTAYGGILQCRGSFGSNNVTLLKYDNSYPGADGATLVVSGAYEIT